MNKYTHLLDNDPDEFHRLIRNAEWGPISLCLDGDSAGCVLDLLKDAIDSGPVEAKISYEYWWGGNCKAHADFKINGKGYFAEALFTDEDVARIEFPKFLAKEKIKLESDQKDHLSE